MEYVQGWGKRNVDAKRLAAGYRKGAKGAFAQRLVGAASRREEKEEKREKRRKKREEYLWYKVFVIILCQWYSKVHYGR